MMHSLLFATGNKNKLREFQEILGMEMVSVDIDLDEIQEIEIDKIIEHKAREAFKKLGKPVLVEDTGLAFDAWGGLPGGLVKWFMHSVDNEGVLKMMKDFENRHATAITVVGVYDGNELIIEKGEVRGVVPYEIKGEGGFGWDPIFVPEGFTLSFAEMSAEEKNSCSMRKIAAEALKKRLMT